MRILHLTDTHLGVRRRVLGGPRNWSRADDHEQAMRSALQPALRGEVDAVIHSGDVFDRSRPPQAAIGVADALLRQVARCVPTYVIPGNHDRHGVCRTLPVGAPGLTVCDRPTRVVLGDVAIAMVPYRRTPESWRIAAQNAVGHGADWLVAHQAFDGQNVPGLTFRSGVQRDTLRGADVPRGITHILCGHIHPRQRIVTDGITVVTPGSTERTSFSEAQQTKGYAIWDSDRPTPWAFHDLDARPMKRVSQESDLARIDAGDWVATTPAWADAAQRRGALVTVRQPRQARQPRRARDIGGQLSLLGPVCIP